MANAHSTQGDLFFVAGTNRGIQILMVGRMYLNLLDVVKV